MNKIIKSRIAMAILSLIFSMVVAFGAPITTNNTVAAGGHGFYSGTGGVDGGFTTTTDGSLALSVRLAQRYVGPITPTGSNYSCTAGMQCNVDWSIETSGGALLSNFSYTLTIASVTNGGLNISFDPTHPLLGGSYWDPTLPGETMTLNANVTGNQNSEYLGFAFIASSLGGWSPTDQLTVTLSATPTGGGGSTSSQITVNGAIPEPMTFVLMGVGLVGIAALRRRKA